MAFVLGAADPLSIDFNKIYQLKSLEPKKERPHELLWMLWFDEKVYQVHISSTITSIALVFVGLLTE